jgi:RNA polymerase sigma-70 factor (sigma-E family)
MSSRRDDEFTDYVSAGLVPLQRVAYLLCQDRQRAEDLVQATITKLYVHWARARAADHFDAYVRAILVREFLAERRSGWARRVTLSAEPRGGPDAEAAEDREAVIDMRAALARLPRRQRATLVLRFYCDLTIDQAAEVLGCSAGTVKSQTAKALNSLRRMPEVGALSPYGPRPGAARQPKPSEVPGHG